MKTILQKKQTSKPSPKDIERVQIGIEMMQAQFQLIGILKEKLNALLGCKTQFKRFIKTRFQGNQVEALKDIHFTVEKRRLRRYHG